MAFINNSLDTTNVKTIYNPGEQFTTKDLVVTATDLAGETKTVLLKDIPTTYDGITFDANDIGTKEVEVLYTLGSVTAKAHYDIEVEEVVVDFIELKWDEFDQMLTDSPTNYPALKQKDYDFTGNQLRKSGQNYFMGASSYFYNKNTLGNISKIIIKKAVGSIGDPKLQRETDLISKDK